MKPRNPAPKRAQIERVQSPRRRSVERMLQDPLIQLRVQHAKEKELASRLQAREQAQLAERDQICREQIAQARRNLTTREQLIAQGRLAPKGSR